MDIALAREVKEMFGKAIKHGILTDEDLHKIATIVNNRCVKLANEKEADDNE